MLCLAAVGCSTFTISDPDPQLAAATGRVGSMPWGPGGTYSGWGFSVQNITALEWSMTPIEEPAPSLAADGLLHYYAYTFNLLHANASMGGGYAGFQSNGRFNGGNQGKVINFSIWGSNGGEGPDLVNPSSSESNGAQVMTRYAWVPGVKYRFRLETGGRPDDAQGRWWVLYVTDTRTNLRSWAGSIRFPTTIGGAPSDVLDSSTGAFGEDLHWWWTINGDQPIASCDELQRSSMLYSEITAFVGGAASPATSTWAGDNTAEITTGADGYQTRNCPASTYVLGDRVQHNLGWWSPPAQNVAQGSCAPSCDLGGLIKCAGQSDGCGGICNSCPHGDRCNGFGVCSPIACTPSCNLNGLTMCAGQGDGCGGSCRACPGGQVCNGFGVCGPPPCTPSCDLNGLTKCAGQSDGCGGSCSGCGFGQVCNVYGVCGPPPCSPSCDLSGYTKCAGQSDGCGGTCRGCPSGHSCNGFGVCS